MALIKHVRMALESVSPMGRQCKNHTGDLGRISFLKFGAFFYDCFYYYPSSGTNNVVEDMAIVIL
jgi:hypothetical protein